MRFINSLINKMHIVNDAIEVLVNVKLFSLWFMIYMQIAINYNA